MKTSRNLTINLICASLLVITSCATFSEPKITNITITEENADHTTRLKVGQQLQLKLHSNPSTGYHWEQPNKPNPSILLMEGEPTYVQDSAPPGMVGVPGTLTTRYLAKKSGTQNLEWINLPPGQGRAAAQVLNFQIIVE